MINILSSIKEATILDKSCLSSTTFTFHYIKNFLIRYFHSQAIVPLYRTKNQTQNSSCNLSAFFSKSFHSTEREGPLLSLGGSWGKGRKGLFCLILHHKMIRTTIQHLEILQCVSEILVILLINKLCLSKSCRKNRHEQIHSIQ